MSRPIDRLFTSRRFCYFIPVEGHVEGRGWRPSVVFEGEPGHYPNGDMPYEGKPGQTAPWFWGPSYEEAVATADEMNERLGISKMLAVEIVTSSRVVKPMRRPPHVSLALFPDPWRWELNLGVGLRFTRPVVGESLNVAGIQEYLETFSCHGSVTRRMLSDMDAKGEGCTTCSAEIRLDAVVEGLAWFGITATVTGPWARGRPWPPAADAIDG